VYAAVTWQYNESYQRATTQKEINMYFQATATVNGQLFESGFFHEGRDWAIRLLVRQIGFENISLITVEVM